jgi:hypothetical protein
LLKASRISEDLLNSGIHVRIATRGSSMFPFIGAGDRIIIAPEKKINIGDIIVFETSNRMVCHRLVRVFEKGGFKYYQTRGDAYFRLDEPVPFDQILGRVIRVERGRVSTLRRFLLLMYPVFTLGELWNASVISSLIRIKATVSSTKGRILKGEIFKKNS